MKRAICLSGGGARGAYEIGVWKALKKLHIKYDIVTGTSVGALNGALLVQNTFLKAYLLWQRMDFSIVFKEEDLKDFNKSKDTKTLIKMYAKNVLNGGMNVDELESLVNNFLSYKKIKKSKVDFGIVTVNAKTLKPKIITKKNMKESTLCDYLIASASCYPFFRKKQIGTNEFIDGGLHDNLPINLAIDLGATEIIAVDLKAVGIVQPVKDKSIPITYISPKNDIGNFLVFEKNQARRAINYGYNDTMKIFGKLEGNMFTFKYNDLSNNYTKVRNSFLDNLKSFFTFKNASSIQQDLLKIAVFKHLMHNKKDDISSIINETIEFLGEKFNLDQSKIYSINSFHIRLRKKLKEEKSTKEKPGGIPNSKGIIKYYYENFDKAKSNSKIKKELYALSLIFPKEFLGSLYFYTLDDVYGK